MAQLEENKQINTSLINNNLLSSMVWAICNNFYERGNLHTDLRMTQNAVNELESFYHNAGEELVKNVIDTLDNLTGEIHAACEFQGFYYGFLTATNMFTSGNGELRSLVDLGRLLEA